MTTFTVHAPTGDAEADARADRLVLLPEKASFGAFFVPFLWAPWKRLWWVFAGWIVVTVAIEVVAGHVSASLAAIVSVGFAVWFALAANDLARWTWERRGARLVGVVEARDAEEALVRFVARLADPRRPRFGDVVEPAAAAAPAPSTTRPIMTPDLPAVVGWGVPRREAK